MKKFLAMVLGMMLVAPMAFAGAGMWPLSNLPTHTLQQRFGFTPTKGWVRHVQLASVRLAGGCSGSFVSPDGLVLTNHHCVVECLQGISDAKHDYMAHYFYADTREKEKKCPSMEIEQIVQRTNDTSTVNKALAGKNGAAYVAARRAITSKLEDACVHGQPDKWRCQLVSLYHGGQYWMYKYRRYQDVRMVFVPSQPMSFFGGYPDNFNYPRYDFAVAIVRVYVHGKPAHTPDYFRFSAKGPKKGQLVFTSGNPGSTSRGDTIAQLKALRYPIYPVMLGALSHDQGLYEAFRAQSKENARIARGSLFYTNNDIQSISGQLQALNNQTQFARKEKAQADLRAKIDADPALRKKYGDAWANIAAIQNKETAMFLPLRMIAGQQGFDAKLYHIAFTLVLGAHERTLPQDKRLGGFRTANLPRVEQGLFSKAPVHAGFDRLRLESSLTMMRNLMGADAPINKTLFADASPEMVAKHAVDGTRLADIQVRKALWNGGEKAVAASHDPMIELARKVLPYYLKMHKQVEDEIGGPMQANTAKVAHARFAVYGTSVAPDATFTERVSYGVVKGWNEHGKHIPAFTTVGGLYEHAKGYPPLKLSRAWLDAKGALDAKMPMNFVSTNDIVGGNSGSPVIDRNGHLVGLIFDGNRPSLGGAFWYNVKLNRAVAVDSAAIIAALKHVYHAKPLVHELTHG